MSKIVHDPPRVHTCSPGWTWKESEGPAGPRLYGTPPVRWDYPRGTVWECDCGRTWISGGRCSQCWQIHFRREGRIARWRRERRAKP